MKVYNRALDYVCLALNELATNKNPVLAARLLADAAKQADVKAAIKTLEISNAHAHKQMELAAAASKKPVAASKTGSKARLKASEEGEEFPFAEEGGEEEPVAEEGTDFAADPLDEVEDAPAVGEEEEEPVAEEPAVAMAKVLSSMQRTSKAAAKK